MHWILSFLLVVLSGAALHTRAAESLAQRLDGLDPFVEELLALSLVPGAAVAVVAGDSPPVVRGYGRRIAGGEVDVDGDTIFAIGSMTKHFTATALGLLVTEQKLRWDDPLARHLPGLRFSDPYLTANLSVEDALSHRSGLARADLFWFARPGLARDEMMAAIEHLPQEQAFRASYLYNNFLYLAAGQLIPQLAGASWDEFVQARLLQPLAMHRSGSSLAALEQLSNVAQPHYLTPTSAVTTRYFDLAHVAPAGALYSSATDMATWCQAQLWPEEAEQQVPGLVSAMQATREPRNFMPLDVAARTGNRYKSYTLGLERMNYGDQNTVYTHGGAIQGMASNIAFIPDAGVCVAVLTNGETGSGVRYDITRWVLDRLLGLAPADYRSEFLDNLHQRRERYRGAGQLHAASHDPAATPAVPSEALVGRYRHPLYGEMSVALESGALRTQYGTAFRGELRPHGGITFDVLPDDPVRRQVSPAPFSLSVSTEKSGAVESVLLQMPGPQREGIRFQRVESPQ
ncbi:serine hydrolase [Parahaliea mediterranea]|uniref:serine hydrolase n=1 Tax=Parahaliea mediterranea TaxID=651086 RepID=UPI000E2E9573|nr:serine hydrolase [Parahaliea mediterranea]